MMRRTRSMALAAVMAATAVIGGGAAGSAWAADLSADALLKAAQKVFQPLPEKMPGSENDTKARIELGRKLYNETAISINNTQSCNSCHRLDENMAGVDNAPTSSGAQGQLGGRNAPTTLNAGFHVAQFWDGRAPDLAAQAKGPVLNPIEMGMPDQQLVLSRLAEAGYDQAFKAAFPDADQPLTYDNYAEAVAAFERTLITRDRFDDFLKGDVNAIPEQAQKGLALFLEIGCAECHAGPLLGGDRYEKLGVASAYANTQDLGRYEVTKKEEDKLVFKVPSLRNIALTGPYFHDGKVPRLGQAVMQMAQLQLGVELEREQTMQISAFLRTLSDKQRARANAKQRPQREPGAARPQGKGKGKRKQAAAEE